MVRDKRLGEIGKPRVDLNFFEFERGLFHGIFNKFTIMKLEINMLKI